MQNRNVNLICIALAINCSALLSAAQAVSPPPSGSYPRSNTTNASNTVAAQTGPAEESTRVDVGTNEEFNKRWRAPEQSRSGSIQDQREIGIARQQIGTTANLPSMVKELFFKNEESAHKFKKSSPSPAIPPFMPFGGGCIDPMIAVGEKYIIISDTGNMSFFHKDGTPLEAKEDGSGIQTTWNMTDFFQPMLDAANSGSFSWLSSAPNSLKTTCNPLSHACDSANPGQAWSALCAAYDTRIIYEPVNKRFIIVSAMRNMVWQNATGCDKWAVRTFGFAVSNGEDPRDGFKMWYWTKSNYRDWPRVTADKDVVTVMHNQISGDDGTPVIYAISLKDMLNGVNHPRWFAYLQGSDGVPSSSTICVAKFPSSNTTFDDYVMFLEADGNKAVLYYYKKSADMWTNKPRLRQAYITLDNPLDLSWQDMPVYRNGNVYFTSVVEASPEEVNVRPPLYGFYLYRLPLKMDGNKIAFHNNQQLLSYPVLPPAATSSELTSYEVPAVSVDSKGTMLVAYGRLAKRSSGPIFPEARYFVFFGNENSHRLSQQLIAGNFMPKFTPYDWTANQTIDGFYHYSEHDTEDYIDYSTVTVDPSESSTFWIAHAFADQGANGYRMAVGKVQAKK